MYVEFQRILRILIITKLLAVKLAQWIQISPMMPEIATLSYVSVNMCMKIEFA